MTEKDAVSVLYRLYVEEQHIADKIKEAKDRIKEAGLNAAIISAVAKSIVTNKVTELKEKSKTIVEIIEKVS